MGANLPGTDAIRHYQCLPVVAGFPIDGDLEKAVWQPVPWTEDFVDILGGAGAKPWYRTRAKMAFSDEALYIAAELEEPHLWATLTEHDSVIFQDNDFEVFIDPDGDQCLYAELEINALNTTWDLLLTKPYRAGGAAIDGFELHGIRTAVRLNGTLNDPSDTDTGWTVEIAIPWRAFSQICRGAACPPLPGDLWRINFSRVQWHVDITDGSYQKAPNRPEENWVWSPQLVVDMHRPARWGVLQFGGDPRALGQAEARETLVEIWEAQRSYRETHERFAASLADLSMGHHQLVHLEATTNLFEASLHGLRIDQDACLRKAANE
ncbi:MAG: carbohydrate-binding family 9-like protein [Fimbriimonas sp.]